MVAESPFSVLEVILPDQTISQTPWYMMAFHQSPHWGTAHGNISDFRYVCALALGNCVKGL